MIRISPGALSRAAGLIAWVKPLQEEDQDAWLGTEEVFIGESVAVFGPIREVRLLRTADFACSKSGRARTRFGAFFRL